MLSVNLKFSDVDPFLRKIVQETMDLVNADAGLFYDLLIDPELGGLRIGKVLPLGDEKVCNISLSYAGTPYTDLLDDPADAVDSFQPLGEFGLADATNLPQAFVDGFLKPAQINNCLSMNIIDAGRFAGNLTVYRTGDSEPFDQYDASTLRPHVNRLGGAVIAASMSQSKSYDDLGVLAFTTDGKIRISSGVDANEMRHILEPLVINFRESSEVHSSCILQHYYLRLIKVMDEDGCFGGEVLVILKALEQWEVPEIVKLNPSQRRIAALAAKGASAEEIAEVMCRSRATIATHLKTIYTALNISTRAELARLAGKSAQQG